jgi:uncharacterized damage-inducible protein DinB
MSMNQAYLMEFEHEMAGTRTTLERVPFEKADWRPHPKSFTLASLATHVARVPGWAKETLTLDVLDFATMDMAEMSKVMGSREELLALFDKNVAAGRAAISGTSDAEFMKPWTMRNGEKVYMTMPKVAVLRSFVLSHTIHHRAQLGVYLRMLDVPVPALFGPSADEGAM